MPNSDANISYVNIPAAIRKIRGVVNELSACIELLEICTSEITAKSPCTTCERKVNCSNICEALEKHLSHPYAGQTHGERIAQLPIDALPIERRVDIFKSYQECKHILTDKQWEAIYLYYCENKTQDQIAAHLDKKRSTIGELLKRAEKRKDNYDKKLRQEQREFIQKLNR